MAIAAATPAFSFHDGRLSLRGEDVPILYYPDADEFWMRAKQIHSFTGAATMTHTMQRVDEGDKYSLKELVQRKGLPPRGGSSYDPEDHNEGKAIYVNKSGFYSIVLESKKPECKAFKRWVTHEVLPQIRRTGQYHARNAEAVVPTGPLADHLTRLLTTVETHLATVETRQDEILAQLRGSPLPVAKFLDQKQQGDSSLADVRRSLAPTFGTVVQVLKKRKIKEEGGGAVYVEQNQRLQIYYTEEDRDLMETAWEMTEAHREDLMSRRSGAPALPAAPRVPRVLAMLQGAAE